VVHEPVDHGRAATVASPKTSPQRPKGLLDVIDQPKYTSSHIIVYRW
jgi:hypothetical protein